MQVNGKNQAPWYLTAVYGAPQWAKRQQLWENLDSICSNVVGPWAVIGDFNCILNASKKKEDPQHTAVEIWSSLERQCNTATLLMLDLEDTSSHGIGIN